MESVIFNTHDVILLITAWQCILVATLLLTLSRGHMPRNLFLALFLLSHAAIPMDILINFGAEFRNVALNFSPNLFYIFGFAYWLEGPLLLWYTRSVIYKDYQPKRHEWLYLVPFMAYVCYEIFFYYSLTPEAKLALQQGYQLELAPKYMNYVTLFREFFRLAFGVACLLEIRRYRATLRENYSDIQALDFKWLNLLVMGFLIVRIMAVIVVIMIFASLHFGFSMDYSSVGLSANYLAFLLVSILIFFSLTHSWMIGGVAENDALENDCGTRERCYDDKQIDRLLEHMHREKPYLQHSLTISQLAQQVGIHQKVLSTIINRHFDCNFFEFINRYRIEEVKEILLDPTNTKMSVLDALYTAGFNSKATFNTLFKKAVGQTPSEFRRRNSKKEASIQLPDPLDANEATV